jgi:hypothetical protein
MIQASSSPAASSIEVAGMLQRLKFLALITASLIALGSVSSMAGDAAAPADPSRVPDQETVQADLEMQLLVKIFSVKEFCKEIDAPKAADYESSWTTELAAAPPSFKDIVAKPDFTEKVTQRLADLRAMPDAKQDAMKVCDTMLAKK